MIDFDQAAQDAIEGRSSWKPALRPTGGGFAATIGGWARDIPEAIDAVLKGSAQDFMREMQEELDRLVYQAPISPSGYERTGFLKASLVASTNAMPQLIRDNPGEKAKWDEAPVVLVINGWDGDGQLFLGYTAKYGLIVHSGAGNAVPRPWVTLAAQKWVEIVNRRAASVKAAFGL